METKDTRNALGLEELGARAALAGEMLRDCRLCPRNCGVDRTAGEKGFCRVLDEPMVSSWGPHFGEERPLVGLPGRAGRTGQVGQVGQVGRFGSGTVFFTGCNLGCVFCQNWDISRRMSGRTISREALAGAMLELEGDGCHNINLVTPTHQMPMILAALHGARARGMALPIVWNCGGYESVEALRLLDGVVDIYMPDVKYMDPEHSGKYSKAPDYPEAARAALREMHRQVGDLVVDERGIARRGLLVRHLVLPGGLSDTPEVVRFIAEEISRDTYVNIMDQYHPCYKAFEHPPLDRRLTSREYQDAIEAALRAGLRRIDGVTV